MIKLGLSLILVITYYSNGDVSNAPNKDIESSLIRISVH